MSDTCRSSGEITASATLVDGRGLLSGVLVITNGTNDATIILYDNNAASGDKLFEAVVAGANNAVLFPFEKKVLAENGIYVSVAGTGASCIVYHG